MHATSAGGRVDYTNALSSRHVLSGPFDVTGSYHPNSKRYASNKGRNLSFAGFGPELAAIVEEDAPAETRWRYFLRYFQGKVNQEDIADYDDEDEGFRYAVRGGGNISFCN